MCKKISFVFILMVITGILLSACGGSSTAPAAEEIAAQPTATFTPDPKLDLNVFMEALTESLTAHDFERLEPLIGTPFSLASIGSGSSSLPAADLIKRMEKTMLPDSSTPIFLPDADLTPILGEHVPTSLGPGLKVASILYSQGWGEDGTGESIIYVSQLPDETFAWYGMVYAKDGFEVLAEEEEPEVELDCADLETFKQGLLDALSNPDRTTESLLPLMNDPFIWAGWQSEGVELPPVDALPNLEEMLPLPEAISYDAEAAFTELLDGQEPQAIFPAGVDFLHMTVWGADSAGEAILVIGQDAAGLYTWAGVLNAPVGFQQ